MKKNVYVKKRAEEDVKTEKPQETTEAEKKTATAPVVKKAAIEEKKPERKSILDEINPDREKQKAKEEADKLYLEAINEVVAE
jgi:hypothetical protein